MGVRFNGRLDDEEDDDSVCVVAGCEGEVAVDIEAGEWRTGTGTRLI
jgi:hypothetical protein